ncbi:uncharacterized protein [Haliotis cracherodii]|uniref:uncharacterized protein n=1 Tax=Haliotis cracherodii TaxID=6455 RepID=UPI0039E84965
MTTVTSVVAAVLVLMTIAHGTPVLSRAKRVDTHAGKVKELRQKLLQLQEMLEDINNGKEKDDVDNTLKTSSPVAIGSKIERNSREPMRSEYDDQAPTRQDKVKLLATRLVDGDRKTLKMLENTLAHVRSQEEAGAQQDEDIAAGDELGFHEEVVADNVDTRQEGSDTGADTDVERDIMTLLRRYKQRASQDILPRSRSQQVIEEGHFGDFRHEVLHAVEDRLLKDIQMALHSGFTVKDIIQDLESPDEEWGDTKKREIERELDTLKSLRRTD